MQKQIFILTYIIYYFDKEIVYIIKNLIAYVQQYASQVGFRTFFLRLR